jgi:hypothetical protein
LFWFGFFSVLGFEFGAYTFKDSISLFFCEGFFQDSLANYLPGLASNCNPDFFPS